MRAKTPKRQRGGETVEFALFTLPVMVLIFVTFVEFGFGFADKAVIVDASRAAAREAIKGGTNTEICAAANQVLASAGTWGTSDPYSCPSSCGDGCQIQSPRGTDPGDPIVVTLTFPFQFRILPPLSEIRILSFIPNFGDIQLTGETVMYIP